jgi:hypothetical protein
MIIAIILIGIGLGIFTSYGIFKAAEATNIFLVAALVLVTAIYAKESERSRKAMEEQRLDSVRPLLVPVGGSQGIAYLEPGVLGQPIDPRALHVHNVGVGPAENIAIRLELRSRNGHPTVQLDEMETAVEPLASGDKGIVRQWKHAKKSVEIYDDYWIVIGYDDLFGRHFETEARRIKETDGWVSARTVLVRKPRPRVREADYHGSAFGRGYFMKPEHMK